MKLKKKTGHFRFLFWRYLPLFLIFILALVIRLWTYSERSLWFDEIEVALFSKLNIGEILATRGFIPLVYSLVHFSIKIFGESEASIRLPSLLAGLSAIPLFYWQTKYFFGNRVALLAALFMATTGLHIRQSQEARYYAVFVLLTMSSSWLTLKISKEKKVRLFPWLIVIWLLILSSTFLAYFSVATEILFLALYFKKELIGSCKKVAKKPLLAMVILLAMGVVFFIFNNKVTVLSGENKTFLDLVATNFHRPLPAGFYLSPRLFYEIASFFLLGFYANQSNVPFLLTLGPFFLLGLYRLRQQKEKNYLFLALSYFLTPLALFVLVKPQHFFHPRHFIFWLPFFFQILALGTDKLFSLASAAIKKVLPDFRWSVAISLLLAFFIIPLPILRFLTKEYFRAPWWEDWKNIGKIIAENGQDGDFVAIQNSTQSGSAVSLPYYLDRAYGKEEYFSHQWRYIALERKPVWFGGSSLYDKTTLEIYGLRILAADSGNLASLTEPSRVWYVSNRPPNVDGSITKMAYPLSSNQKLFFLYYYPETIKVATDSHYIFNRGWIYNASCRCMLTEAVMAKDARLIYSFLLPQTGQYDLYVNLRKSTEQSTGLLSYRLDEGNFSSPVQPELEEHWQKLGYNTVDDNLYLGKKNVTSGEHIIEFRNFPKAGQRGEQLVYYFLFIRNYDGKED